MKFTCGVAIKARMFRRSSARPSAEATLAAVSESSTVAKSSSNRIFGGPVPLWDSVLAAAAAAACSWRASVAR